MVQIYGHRGCRFKKGIAENSLTAFQTAIIEGADGIELDVFLTTDNVLVVFHDDNLENLSSGHGAIVDKSLAELNQLSLREWAGSDVFTGDKIPTLDEVLDLAESFREADSHTERLKNLKICIEIKGLGIAGEASKCIKQRLSNKRWLLSNFEVRSFDMASLNEMKEAMPKLQLGILLEGGEYPWDISEELLEEKLKTNKNLFQQPEKFQPDNTVSITLDSMTDEALRIITNIVGINYTDGKPLVTPWTAGEKNPEALSVAERKQLFDKLNKLIGEGSAFITDFPGEIISLIKSQRELNGNWQLKISPPLNGPELGL